MIIMGVPRPTSARSIPDFRAGFAFWSCSTFLIKFIFSFSAWLPVKLNENIPFDLESTSLQIKTNSADGSFDRVNVFTKDGQKSKFGTIAIQFSSPIRYKVHPCSSEESYTKYETLPHVLPTQPPDDVEKIWTFTKTSTALIISCNGVEVLNYVFSDSSFSDCVPLWSRDTEYIYFNKEQFNDAVDFYRAGKNLILNLYGILKTLD